MDGFLADLKAAFKPISKEQARRLGEWLAKEYGDSIPEFRD